MLISEQSFPHLQAAHDARLEQELERRRVAQERVDQAVAAGASGGLAARRRRAWWQPSGERMPRAGAVHHGPTLGSLS
jgi:hypothetical protein